ncbi:unnamed protein product (macronuclear) [Paramecium tetraurelia]|uniref:Phosphoribulokinase/uridine kinase domain-containing protein n=1 Tax=Paramecium tetraurelia TaxID=5888 RepID=A0CNV4_PARTE|nr:uncharacterized protein GSPATT00008913001 [Paramecium tetraurelia]CAK72471.1 unnamed protein product [Paramecium tetraurelia]|eukprot:XP_001439868.1 hypothetical protein (macronuclear) [Paramecium tetraurelia strain d4-2]
MNNLAQLEEEDGSTKNTTREIKAVNTTIKAVLGNQLVRSNSSPIVQPLSGKTFKIGICGGHSSGKALLTEKLMNQLQQLGFQVSVVKQDNFDVDSNDFDNYKQNSDVLNNVPYVNNQDYQKFLSTAIKTLLTTRDKNVIIIEGTLIFYDRQLRDLLDLKIFLHHDQDVRLSRKIYKEVCAKGKDVEKVIHNYLNRLKPLYESIIKPTEQYADIIVPKFGGEFTLKPQENQGETQQMHAGFSQFNPNILNLLIEITKENILGSDKLDKLEKLDKIQASSK